MDIPLPFSPLPLRVRNSLSGSEVFDVFRKKWVRFTPEEFIRQQYLHHMISRLNYPITSIAVEKTINYNRKKKRFDAMVLGESSSFLMVLEFKRPEILLSEETVLQASAYAYTLQIRSIFLTNGKQQFFFACSQNGKSYTSYELPSYQDLIRLV